MRKKAGICFSSKGLEVLINTGERFFFSSIEEFRASPYSRIYSALAICRDSLFVRKWKLPRESETNLREAIYLNIEDIFPYNEESLEFIHQVIDIGDKYIDLIVIAVKKELIDALKELKSIKLIVPSVYIYPMVTEEDLFTIKWDDCSELVEFREGKLVNWFISHNKDKKELEIDIPKLLLEALEQRYKPEISFLDRRLFLDKKTRLYVGFLSIITLFFLLLAVGNIVYWKYKTISINRKIKELEKYMPEYTKLNEGISIRKSVLDRISLGSDPLELLSFISIALPKSSWITEFSYQRGEFNIKGYAQNEQELEASIKQNLKQVELKVNKQSDNLYEYTLKGGIK